MSNLSELIGGGGGGAWEFLSSTTLSGTARTVDITWTGITLSDYSAIVIKIEGLKNARAEQGSVVLSGYTMSGDPPTALTGSSYYSVAGFIRTTNNTGNYEKVIFPSLYSGSYNTFMYIENPSSTSIVKKSVSMMMQPMGQGTTTQSYFSNSSHQSNTSSITGFRFEVTGGFAGSDYLVGAFRVYGVKAL